jgi:peptidoglycan/xylan/chitin deacetylase (PgdA/CDA1 family)
VQTPRSVAGLTNLRQGTNVDIEGPGEILRITALPTTGQRKLTLGRNGLLGDVEFLRVPRPFTITRTGYLPGAVALTFDDGPDPHWTPQILDILKQKRVPATFFIVGENALTERGLLDREIREGHEIGSHTYTHPNLANADNTRTCSDSTPPSAVPAFTGRTLKLFRAPFFGDAEPTTADEIVPAWEAQSRGYLSVGLHVDSEDWQRPGVAAIVKNVVSNVLKNDQCDSLPKRSAATTSCCSTIRRRQGETIAALPIIIDTLRARGYRFVPVSELAGLSPQQAMPPLSLLIAAASRRSWRFRASGVRHRSAQLHSCGRDRTRDRPRFISRGPRPPVRLEGPAPQAADDGRGRRRQRPHPGIQRGTVIERS